MLAVLHKRVAYRTMKSFNCRLVACAFEGNNRNTKSDASVNCMPMQVNCVGQSFLKRCG